MVKVFTKTMFRCEVCGFEYKNRWVAEDCERSHNKIGTSTYREKQSNEGT